MAREATFNFVPESTIPSRKERKQEKYWVSVSRDYNVIRFAPAYIQDKHFDAKFIKLYYDTNKKTIGWRLMKENNLQDLDGYRKIKITHNKSKKGYESKVCSLGIKSILDALNIKEGAKFKNLPIGTYREGGLLGNQYDYVTLA